MAVTAQAVGTQVAVVGTEHFVSAVAVAGTYTFHVSTRNMLAGDALELRVYQIVLTGDAAEVVYMQSYTGALVVDDAVKVSVPISNELTDANALRFSLKQTAGVARSFPWKVLRYG
jgi:hypothetical protein